MSPRETLRHLLAKHAVKQNRILLTSGAYSDFFIEARRVTLSAAGAHFIGLTFLDKFKELGLNVDAVGGVESAAPIAVSISAASFLTEKQIQTFLIRRRTTFNGKKLWVDNYQYGGFTVLVEDVTTNGNSIVDSLTKAAEVGFDIKAVVTLIDREEGSARIKDMCPFYSVYTASEIFELNTTPSKFLRD